MVLCGLCAVRVAEGIHTSCGRREGGLVVQGKYDTGKLLTRPSATIAYEYVLIMCTRTSVCLYNRPSWPAVIQV